MTQPPKPILLFDDQCSVCRHIAWWVRKLAKDQAGASTILDLPIGNNPKMLRSLNPDLDIWDAYATIHVVMPDGTMKLGGEAVAEVFRRLPKTSWFTWTFAISVLGFRPFQTILNFSYTLLADVRPIFGCESCGSPAAWVKPIRWLMQRIQAAFGVKRRANAVPHFSRIPAKTPRPASGLQSDRVTPR